MENYVLHAFPLRLKKRKNKNVKSELPNFVGLYDYETHDTCLKFKGLVKSKHSPSNTF